MITVFNHPKFRVVRKDHMDIGTIDRYGKDGFKFKCVEYPLDPNELRTVADYLDKLNKSVEYFTNENTKGS